MKMLNSDVKQWLTSLLGKPFTADRHAHSHQDEAYRITTDSGRYYLKLSKTLRSERDNLIKLAGTLPVPEVIGYHHTNLQDYLLITEMPGKNLVELSNTWSPHDILTTFAQAVKALHAADVTKVFPEAQPGEVLIHGDMALPNIIVSDAGHIGYIDFGQLAHGTPELDLVDSIWSLQRNLGQGYGEAFLEAYGPVTRTPKIEEMLSFAYRS